MTQCVRRCVHMTSAAGPPVSPEDCGMCSWPADDFFLVIGSLIFSQQTAAYCLLLGGIKLCVLVGCCGGEGGCILCDMAH